MPEQEKNLYNLSSDASVDVEALADKEQTQKEVKTIEKKAGEIAVETVRI